jgi:hypothetical protein
MTDGVVNAIKDRLELDLAPNLANVSFDRTAVADLCALAAQLCFTEIITNRTGCAVAQAEEFVRCADELSIGVELLGAVARGSGLAAMSKGADAFAVTMLDMIIARDK